MCDPIWHVSSSSGVATPVSELLDIRVTLLYDARPTVIFPAVDGHRSLIGTKLCCLVTEARGCEQLAQRCCAVTTS